MSGNQELNRRREAAVARAVAYSSTFAAARAENAEVWDVDGKRYIDFCGGIGCQNTGHRHPAVIDAMTKQMNQLTHTCFQISPYESYVQLAEELNRRGPGTSRKKSLFFSAGGEAVENAVKIARYHTRRPGIIAFSNGYHGRTYMGMALSARMDPFKLGFRPFPTEIYRIPFPDEFHGVSLRSAVAAMDSLFRSDADPDSIGAVIFEPVQGEGGYNVIDREFLIYLRALCDEHGIVLIADEIQSGFGRTGKLFCMEHFEVNADLYCLGKSMGGGLPLSGVTGEAHIIDSVPPGGLGGTFGGNPIACAAALAVLRVIDEENLLVRGAALGDRVQNRLSALARDEGLPWVGDARGIGCMNAVEIVQTDGSNRPDGERAGHIVANALKNGLVLVSAGPQRNVIRILVPLTASDALVDEGLDILCQAIRQT